jgi:hypothetical protein
LLHGKHSPAGVALHRYVSLLHFLLSGCVILFNENSKTAGHKKPWVLPFDQEQDRKAATKLLTVLLFNLSTVDYIR